MGIKRKENVNNIIIDLDGPEGNSFFILGFASKLGRKIGMGESEIEFMLDTMKLDDYEYLLKTFIEYFPFVELETSNEDLIEKLL